MTKFGLSDHDDHPGDLAELLTPRFEAPKPADREGLPPGYRMRADAHYVDQLTERSPEPTRTAAGASRQAATAEVTPHVLSAIATIQSAAGLASDDGSPTVRRVALDLIRAAAWRAAWHLRAAAVLDQTHRWQFRPRLLGAVLARVRDGFAADGRLRGVGVTLNVVDWNLAGDVDEEALVAGVAGAVVATAGLMDAVDSPHVSIMVHAADGADVAIDVMQDAVNVDRADADAFFEPARPDRLGGQLAATGAAIARAVARRHAGDATFEADAECGSTVRLTLAIATPANSKRNPHA